MKPQTMNHIIIITHETLGQAHLQLAQHFFGTLPEHVHIIGIQPDAQPDDVLAQIDSVLQQQTAAGWLLLADIFGATPCNVARRILAQPNTVLLAGMNAPMLIKAIQYAPKINDLNELADLVERAARDGIMRVGGLQGD